MPTVSTITSCPSADSVPTEIPSGPVKLARSEFLCVLTKAVPDSNGALSLIAPVALSYDNGAWEKAAGEFAMKLLYGQEFGDYSDGSQITLPDLNNTGKYYLTSYSHTVKSSFLQLCTKNKKYSIHCMRDCLLMHRSLDPWTSFTL